MPDNESLVIGDGDAETRVTTPASQSLSDAHRHLARDRIRGAARRVIASRGLDATAEEIALEANVSVRTVFRHYPTRDLLLAEGVKEVLAFVVRPITGLPDPAADLDEWLAVLSLEVHRRLAHELGQAFWDIRVPDPAAPQTSAQSQAGLRFRMRGIAALAAMAWSAAGGYGNPPQWLVENFALYFSPFATQALASDFNHSPQDTATLAAKTLRVLLDHANTEHGDNPGGVIRGTDYPSPGSPPP